MGHCGFKVYIDPSWKVLDVGSRHNLFRRVDVLVGKEIDESIHRAVEKALVPEDKVMVIADATNMPFADKTFDYVVASHVAEHIIHIEKFLKELEGVGRRDYIETPGPLSEYLLNKTYHIWLVENRNGVLTFKKKKRFKPALDFFYALFYLNQNRSGRRTIHSDNLFLKMFAAFLRRIWKYLPFTYTKYSWEETIKYKVIE